MTEKAKDAIRYMLDQIQISPDLRWLMLHTEAHARLCDAEAEYRGEDAEAVRERRQQGVGMSSLDEEAMAELSGVRLETELARLSDTAATALDNVGVLLRAVRERRGYTLAFAAAQIGTNAGTLSTLESGSRAPSPDMLRKIARWAKAAYQSKGATPC